MHVRIRELAAGQADVVAAWQLLELGWTPDTVRHRVRQHGWRRLHRGVYALTSAPLTRRQHWFAATLTAPGTVLSHASAAACWGFRPFEARFETVARPGNGGPRRLGRVFVSYSRTLEGDTTKRDGIAITTAARTLIDLAAGLDDRTLGRAFREALRLKTTTPQELGAALIRHRSRRGTAALRELAKRYARIPYQRTRSDAEALALQLLRDAGVEPPRVNVRIAGEEADLTWPDRRLIVEIDGPQFHRFPEEDARKQRRWESAGYEVRRVATDLVYKEPGRLIAAVCAPARWGRNAA